MRDRSGPGTSPGKKMRRTPPFKTVGGRRWGRRPVDGRGRPSKSSRPPVCRSTQPLPCRFRCRSCSPADALTRQPVGLAAAQQGHHHAQQAAGDGHNRLLPAAAFRQTFKDGAPAPATTHQPPRRLDQHPTQQTRALFADAQLLAMAGRFALARRQAPEASVEVRAVRSTAA